jgi:hypothetical protein
VFDKASIKTNNQFPVGIRIPNVKFQGNVTTVIALMMEAAFTSETSVYFETTLRYILKGYHLQTVRT